LLLCCVALAGGAALRSSPELSSQEELGEAAGGADARAALKKAKLLAQEANAAARAYSHLEPLDPKWGDVKYAAATKQHELAKTYAEKKSAEAQAAYRDALALDQTMTSLMSSASHTETATVADLKESAGASESKKSTGTLAKKEKALEKTVSKLKSNQGVLLEKVEEEERKLIVDEREIADAHSDEAALQRQLQVETRLRKADEAYEASQEDSIHKRLAKLEAADAHRKSKTPNVQKEVDGFNSKVSAVQKEAAVAADKVDAAPATTKSTAEKKESTAAKKEDTTEKKAEKVAEHTKAAANDAAKPHGSGLARAKASVQAHNDDSAAASAKSDDTSSVSELDLAPQVQQAASTPAPAPVASKKSTAAAAAVHTAPKNDFSTLMVPEEN